jgi:hypothetical protein
LKQGEGSSGARPDNDNLEMGKGKRRQGIRQGIRQGKPTVHFPSDAASPEMQVAFDFEAVRFEQLVRRVTARVLVRGTRKALEREAAAAAAENFNPHTSLA